MTDTQEPTKEPIQAQHKKGVSIQIMFPCDDDDLAITIKKAIDEVVKDISEKRCTFSISEV